MDPEDIPKDSQIKNPEYGYGGGGVSQHETRGEEHDRKDTERNKAGRKGHN